MLKANEFCVEWCFPFQIVHKHGLLYFTSELKKITCFALRQPPPPPLRQFFIFLFLEVRKVSDIEANQMQFGPSTLVDKLPR